MIAIKIPPSIAHAFYSATNRNPDKVLLYFEGKRYSYGEMLSRVACTAGILDSWGLKRGDRVALYLENSPGFIETYLSVLWLGAVIVPINTRYRENELKHMRSDSDARLVVTDQHGIEVVRSVPQDISAVEKVIEMNDDGSDSTNVWSDLAQSTAIAEPSKIGLDDLAVIGYTSGTTGQSKGAMLSHGNFLTNSWAVTKAWGWTSSDHLLLVLPLFHMHGLGVGFHGTLIQGSTLTLRRQFNAGEVLNTLAEEKITMFFGVPTMYSRLLKEVGNSRESASAIRLLVSGSAPISPQILQEVEQKLGSRIIERYGMTETVMNIGNPLDGERKLGSVGVPFEGVDVRIVDPATGEAVEVGVSGEIQLKGPNVCKGYWRNQKATDKAFTADGWLRTGDLGYQDKDGYYYLNGRAKELIISGGFNVYPREVEELLEQHPSVREVAVLGLPDPDLGEKVAAAIVPTTHEIPVLEELQDYCRAKLAGFKKPRELFYVSELPRNALGKVQKHLLRDQMLNNNTESGEKDQLVQDIYDPTPQ